MSCQHQQLIDLIDGILPDCEQARLEMHLETCEFCRRELELCAAPVEFWQDASHRLTRADSRSQSTQFSIGLRASETPQTLMEVLRQWPNAPSPDHAKDSMGSVGKYDLHEVLGYGGMGVVIRAADREIRRSVAIKTLLQPLRATPTACDRLIREATAVASLDHKNVITIYSVESWRDVPFIVMPFVPGGTLAELASRRRLTVVEALSVAGQVANALCCAHAAGITHRDIKPSNILLQDGCRHVLLADFGLARVAGEHTLTETGAIPGTPQFMSPEQARGQAIDQRSDQFSLGSLLFWMLTGQSLFAADSQHATLLKLTQPSSLKEHSATRTIPVHLQRLLQKLLQQDPSARYDKTVEVASHIESCLEYETKGNSSALPAELRRPDGKLLRLWWGGAVALVLLSFAFVWGMQAIVGGSEESNEKSQLDSLQQDMVSPQKEGSTRDGPLQYGPLDELEVATAKEQLEAGEQQAYWLRRLAYLEVESIPPELLPAVEAIAETKSGSLHELALVILRKDPFVEVKETPVESSPFKPVK